MKKQFYRGKIFAGDDRRQAVPLCRAIGKAVFTHASETVKSPFIMLSREGGGADELLQAAVGDAICSLGGEVLLLDDISLPAAALLTRKYRADITLAAAGGRIEILDATGCPIGRDAEIKIETLLDTGAAGGEVPPRREGEIYGRRDAYLDYCGAILEASGKRKLSAKIAAVAPEGNVQKAAAAVFSRLTKNAVFYTGAESVLGSAARGSGAALGFAFSPCGRRVCVADEKGAPVDAEAVYCLLAAKMAEKDVFGNTVKQSTGKGIHLRLLEGGAVHFGDILPGPDGIFTAVMLSIYASDKDAPLSELVRELAATEL
jgi:phosphomannomutase